jgi:hypothetical protein
VCIGACVLMGCCLQVWYGQHLSCRCADVSCTFCILGDPGSCSRQATVHRMQECAADGRMACEVSSRFYAHMLPQRYTVLHVCLKSVGNHACHSVHIEQVVIRNLRRCQL